MIQGPDLKTSYDLSEDYLKFVVRLTYYSDLKHAKISLRNNVGYFTKTVSGDLMILQVNCA